MKRVVQTFKHHYWNSRIYLKYGEVYPERVTLVGSDQHLHVDAHDQRARKKILANNIRGRFPRNRRFWSHAAATLQPDLVLDIGLNYGECLFSVVYPEGASLIGFEANPRLQSYITRSQSEHPNADQIECCFEIVSDSAGGVVDFFIRKDWSGGSTAAIQSGEENNGIFEKIQVGKTTVDQVVFAHQENVIRTCLFKIDIEGYEFRALSGMKKTLETAERAIGFVEFDPKLLAEAGEDVDTYWSFLTEHFDVFAFDRTDAIHAVTDWTLQQLKAICGRSFHTDFILIKKSQSEDSATLIQILATPFRAQKSAA